MDRFSDFLVRDVSDDKKFYRADKLLEELIAIYMPLAWPKVFGGKAERRPVWFGTENQMSLSFFEVTALARKIKAILRDNLEEYIPKLLACPAAGRDGGQAQGVTGGGPIAQTSGAAGLPCQEKGLAAEKVKEYTLVRCGPNPNPKGLRVRMVRAVLCGGTHWFKHV